MHHLRKTSLLGSTEGPGESSSLFSLFSAREATRGSCCCSGDRSITRQTGGRCFPHVLKQSAGRYSGSWDVLEGQKKSGGTEAKNPCVAVRSGGKEGKIKTQMKLSPSCFWGVFYELQRLQWLSPLQGCCNKMSNLH